ncbi:hypothetical protein FA13DRAFT_1716731 [Coprinellus micaceus]|uniref:Uncharacterized protein n=1 Tax=Coprinellus micaceus TaxID=71717 RepID=A0A4Y7SIR4_COPMI|nr:hypothetical protein FA13DRAFT_1716731 [Coprinellus micaceus]
MRDEMPTETEREYDEVEGCIGNGVEKELGGGVVEDRLEAVHGFGRRREREMEAYGGKKLREGAAGALESSRVESLGGWDAALAMGRFIGVSVSRKAISALYSHFWRRGRPDREVEAEWSCDEGMIGVT